MIKSWQKLLHDYPPFQTILRNLGEEWEEEDDIPLKQWSQSYCYNPQEWCEQDFNEASSMYLTDEEIILQVQGLLNEEPEPEAELLEIMNNDDIDANVCDNNELELPLRPDLSEHREALKLTMKLLYYFQSQPDGQENETNMERIKSQLVSKLQV